ncbi:hypothetical protein ACOSQ4_003086 [Xanthoceras sorbifolium]
MRGAKHQAQERHRSRPKIWPRRIRAGGPGDPGRRPRQSGQEAQADPGRRPRRYEQEAQADPGRRPRRYGQEAQIRGDDPDEESSCSSGRSGAMTPMRSPGAVPRDPGGDSDEEPRYAVPGDPGR